MREQASVNNDAMYPGDARDMLLGAGAVPVTKCGPVALPPTSGWSAQHLFSGLSAMQRYELDTFGFLMLRAVLAPADLAVAQAAVGRLAPTGSTTAYAQQQPVDFSFATEPTLEALAAHATLLPVLLELGAGAPHLVGGSCHRYDDGNSGSEKAPSRESYTAEAPGRCRCDDLIVFPCLDGNVSLSLVVGSHKAAFATPTGLLEHFETEAVPEGVLRLCPPAGSFVLLPASVAHKIRGSAPLFSLYVKAGHSYVAHCERQAITNRSSESARWATTIHQLASSTAALVLGQYDKLRKLCSREPPPDPGTITKPLPEMLRPAWQMGRNARSDVLAPAMPADLQFGLTATQRRQLDTYGFLHLRSVLSSTELMAARTAYERTRPSWPIVRSLGITAEVLREPALELLATHSKLMPLLMELGGGEPHLILMNLIYQPPRAGPPRTVDGGCDGVTGELHCHRETVSAAPASFKVESSGKISANNINVFHYLEPVEPGDGGLAVVCGSHKAQFSRPRALFWPYSNHADHEIFGPDRGWDGYHEPPGFDSQQLLSMAADGSSHLRQPDGLLHLTPAAGDVLIVPETTSHVVLPWQPTDRGRKVVLARYNSGECWANLVTRMVAEGRDSCFDPPLSTTELDPRTLAMVGSFEDHLPAAGEAAVPRL